ncbi:MAG: AI-2E family transporter [Chitinophagales bacterium]
MNFPLMLNNISNNVIRQVLLLLFIFLLGLVLFVQLHSFIPALLGSYTLFVLLKKPMFILTGRYKWKRALAAAVLMLLSFIVILLPIAMFINMMSSKINFAVQHSSNVLQTLENYIHSFEVKYNIALISQTNLQQLTTWSSDTIQTIVGATFNTIVTIIFTYLILYFMLINGKEMDNALIDWLPMKSENVRILRKETNALVFSNAVGIPLIAIFQGLIALPAYFVLGVKEPMFWFIITCIASMLPVLGAGFAYVPVGILFFAEGSPLKGLLMLAYGFGIVSTVDSIFRFWLQRKIGDVHPLITAFGVILGLNLFGFIGLVFGPILISLFILLIKIYVKEFSVNKLT